MAQQLVDEYADEQPSAEVVRAVARLRGMSDKQLAEAMGLKPDQLSRRLSYDPAIGPASGVAIRGFEVRRMARVLGVEPELLYKSADDVLAVLMSRLTYFATQEQLSLFSNDGGVLTLSDPVAA